MAPRNTPQAPQPLPRRADGLDALRGLAMLWMTLFHLCFDLAQLGWLQADFYRDPFWTGQRVLIVSLFLLCAGMGQALAQQQRQGWGRFARRWLQVAAGAALVSLGSWWMYPQSWIYFGVLHGMAVMLLLVRLSLGWGRWLWVLGGLAIASKFIAASALSVWAGVEFIAKMNAPGLNALGWITQLPVTQDFVPIFPWLGVMWWGVALGQQQGVQKRCHQLLSPVLKPLAVLGRYSLSYYLLHQPVLLAGLYAVKAMLGH